MIHGDHWESVFDFDEKLAKLLKKAIQVGKPSTPRKFPFKDGEKIFKYFTYPETNLRILSVGLHNAEFGAYEIINSIPFCFHGIDIFLRIDEVYVDISTYEAIIESSTIDGMKINFYDSMFFMNMDIYMKDTYRIFRIAGLAYSLFKTKPEVKDLLNKKKETKSEFLTELFKLPNEIEVDKRIAFYNLISLKNLPYKYDYDDCFVQSFIEEVSEFNLEGQKIYQLKVAIDENDKNKKIIIYAAEKIIEPNYIPKVGDNIYAYIWLQGYSTH